MAGSITRRCGCRDPETGRQLGKTCPKLKNPRHGSWGFAIDAPGADGLRLQIRRGGYSTRREAERERDKLAVEVRSGGRRVQRGAGKLTVAEYLRQWIVDKERDGLRATTLESYRHYIRNVWIPAVGNTKIRELHAGQVEETLRRVRERYEQRFGRPLRATSQERMRATLRSALSDAKRQGFVATNAAADAILPKVTKTRVNPWSPAELGAFLDATNGDRLGPLWQLLAMTGLRRGEALGLRWSDIDLAERRLVVHRQLIWVGGGLTFSAPKTQAGEGRVVDLDEHTVGVLLAHQLTGQPSPDGLLFSELDGSPLDPRRITKEFTAAVETAGLRRIRLHDLRHGAASLRLAAGVSIEVTSKVLGHSSRAITADTYSHLLGEVGRKSADAAAALVPRHDRDHLVHTDSSQGELQS